MFTGYKRKQTYIDLIYLSRESVYGKPLSNMADHFCLSLESILALRNDSEHQTNYVENRPLD